MKIPLKNKADRELRACWLKKNDGDVHFYYPGDRRCDARLINRAFCSERPSIEYTETGPTIAFDKSLTDELEARGYDITTIKFSIQLKKDVVE